MWICAGCGCVGASWMCVCMCVDDVDAQTRCLEIFSETDLGGGGEEEGCNEVLLYMWCHASVGSVHRDV